METKLNVTKERELVLRKALVELHNSCPDDTKTQDLIDDLLNGDNVKAMAEASQLLEQNRELVEALKGLPALLNVSADVLQMRAEEMNRDSAYAPQLKSKADIIKELLTKHQKDV